MCFLILVNPHTLRIRRTATRKCLPWPKEEDIELEKGVIQASTVVSEWAQSSPLVIFLWGCCDGSGVGPQAEVRSSLQGLCGSEIHSWKSELLAFLPLYGRLALFFLSAPSPWLEIVDGMVKESFQTFLAGFPTFQAKKINTPHLMGRPS